VIHFVREHRSTLLMVALVVLQLASPLGDSYPHIGGLIALAGFVLLLTGASYIARRKILRRLVFPLAGVWFVARLFEAVEPGPHFYNHPAPIVGLLLSLGILWAILDRFDSIPMVTGNVISEAFISYIVLAIAFSQVYWILNQVLDHAFNEVIPITDSTLLLYFSMISLSTVGYGKIVPVNPFVRMVAAMEAMIGVFFIAVVVARLVSSYRPKPPAHS
jgi:hypothetical protein